MSGQVICTSTDQAATPSFALAPVRVRRAMALAPMDDLLTKLARRQPDPPGCANAGKARKTGFGTCGVSGSWWWV